MTGRPSWLTCCSGRRNNPKLVCHMARRVGHSRTAGRWKYECLAIGNSIEVMKSADAVRWQALRVLTNSPHGRTAKAATEWPLVVAASSGRAFCSGGHLSNE